MLQSLLAPGGSSTIFFVVAAIVGLCVIGLTLLVVLVQASKRARFKRRMNTVLGIQKASKQGGKGQQRRLLIQGKLDEIEGTRKKSTTRASLRQRIEMAGFDFTPKKFYMASAGLALGTLLTVLIMRVGILPALLASATMGLGLPRLVLSYQAARRRGKFIQNFADAVDVIVRGLQSGLPLGECMNVIASEAEEPVCTEFRMVMESARLGLPLTEALQRGVGRIDVPLRNGRPSIPAIVGKIHFRRWKRLRATLCETGVFGDAGLLQAGCFWIDHRKREGLIITLPIAAAAAACGFLGPTDSHTINTLDATEFPLDGSGKRVVLVRVALWRGEFNANDRIVDRDI